MRSMGTMVAVILGGLLLTGASALAETLALPALEVIQQAEASLIHQYTFAPTATDDKEGSADLTQTGTEISFADEHASFLNGGDSYLRTQSAINPGNSFALEFVVRPVLDTVVEGHYISASGLDRFFIFQENTILRARFGNVSDKVTFFSGLSVNDRYYVAMNFTFSDGGGEDDATFTIDAWVGDVVARTLTQVWEDQVFAMVDGTGGWTDQVSYGRNDASGNTSWDGDLDAVAWYNTILSPATIESHFQASFPPPAGTVVSIR